jgi:serine/threonine-protein kinase
MSMRCPACGTVYVPEAKFCPKDGSRLQPNVGSRPATAAPKPTPQGSRAVDPAAPPPPAPAPAAPGAYQPDGPPRVTAERGSPQAGVRKVPGPSAAALVGETLDGRYSIVRKVGEGGMSYVYLAHDVATGERYAIKVLSPALAQDQNAMARLRREAGLGIRLAHPNVCHIMRLGETEDGLVYVVMPFVEGEVLADRTHRLGQIPLPLTVKWVGDIAAGLHVAHQLKIIHRDLKPENVMVCRDEAAGDEKAVVMDFGLAKERKAGGELEKLTATGIILGTPEFMSPEQLRGKPLDSRTDIYSLALMTFEMLTGKLPFAGRTQQEMMIARLRSEPLPLRKARPDLVFPAPVERVLIRGMERDADARHATAPEFAEALAAAAAGDETDAAGGRTSGGLLGRIFGR